MENVDKLDNIREPEKAQSEYTFGGDGNESICGACLKSGELICCENCPAAFHPECAGYESIQDVPDGDWYCFICSRKLNITMVNDTLFTAEVGQTVMISNDRFGDVFYEAKVEEMGTDTIRFRAVDNSTKEETLSRNDTRIWRGTIDPVAWTKSGDNYRPTSRAFEVDYESLVRERRKKAPVVTTPSPWLYPNTEPVAEKGFLEILGQFWKIKYDAENIPWPPFGYIVPLTELWELVQHHGGYDLVCQEDGWSIIAERLTPIRSVNQFPFMLKHTYCRVLLEMELAGGLEAVETLVNLALNANERAVDESRGSSVEENDSQRRPRREKRGLRSAEELLATSENTRNDEDIFSGETAVSSRRKSARKLTASRAVQEYRASIGLVALTPAAKALRRGDQVDVRVYRDNGLGPWRLAEILTISTASAFEGYRRFHVRYISPRHDGNTGTDWVPILARPTAWGTTLASSAVLVRPAVEPHFAPVKSESLTWQRFVGARVEGWLHGGWWPARIGAIRDGSALLQGDVIPLGEGLKWSSSFKYIREAPINEDAGFGMVQSLDRREEVCPKEMEEKLDITVDKTSDGHVVLSFRRLDDLRRVC